MLSKLLCLPKFDCREQGFKYSLAQREVCRNHPLHIFDAFLAVFCVGKVRLISDPPPVIVLHKNAIDNEPKLRMDRQIANLTSSPQGMQFITSRSFALAVVLVALSAIRFLGVEL